MNRLFISTSGLDSWRQAHLSSQWKRRSAAFETAVKWELARERPSGLPTPIEEMYGKSVLGEARLLMAVAGHKVPLEGHNAESRPSVWAIVSTQQGMTSMTVLSAGFGTLGIVEPLSKWLERGYGEIGKAKRQAQWQYIRSFLPALHNDAGAVQYQMLNCCAAAVIEARRVGLTNASFVVQAFKASEKRFGDFKLFCEAIGVPPARNELSSVELAGGMRLAVGWADSLFATEEQIAATVR